MLNQAGQPHPNLHAKHGREPASQFPHARGSMPSFEWLQVLAEDQPSMFERATLLSSSLATPGLGQFPG